MSAKHTRISTKRIARFAMLTALALVLSYVERLIPVTYAVPGIKLGIANTVLLYAIYMMDAKSAAALMVLKVFLTGFMFTGLSSMLYSFAGGLLSLIMMLLVQKLARANIVVVSVLGALFHNIGQMIVVAFITMPRVALLLFPTLAIAGVVMGFLTGVSAKYALKALKAHIPQTRKAHISTQNIQDEGAHEQYANKE